MNIKVVLSYNTLRIFIDNILHLSFKKDSLIGIQSWVEENKYCIEYYLVNGSILSEYDSVVKWKLILKELSKLNY